MFYVDQYHYLQIAIKYKYILMVNNYIGGTQPYIEDLVRSRREIKNNI